MELHNSVRDGKCVIKYEQKIAELSITRAEYDLIKEMGATMKISAIKFIREQYGIGLYDAKQVCESIWSRILQDISGLHLR